MTDSEFIIEHMPAEFTDRARAIADRYEQMEKALRVFVRAYETKNVYVVSELIRDKADARPWHEEWLSAARAALSREGR